MFNEEQQFIVLKVALWFGDRTKAKGVEMKRGQLLVLGLALVLVMVLALPACTQAPAVEKIVIGHPVSISGKYAKAGEQASGGIKAIVKWVNEVYGGVEIAGANCRSNMFTIIVDLRRKW